MNLFEGIMPGRGKGYGRDMYEGARDTGREMYDKATGRSLYDKITGRGITDKAGEYAQDLSYGARRGMETAKDVGYGISHKLGDMAESVKQTFVGERGYGGGEGYGRGEGYARVVVRVVGSVAAVVVVVRPVVRRVVVGSAVVRSSTCRWAVTRRMSSDSPQIRSRRWSEPQSEKCNERRTVTRTNRTLDNAAHR
jgi:hypothetical protein